MKCLQCRVGPQSLGAAMIDKKSGIGSGYWDGLPNTFAGVAKSPTPERPSTMAIVSWMKGVVWSGGCQ